MARLATYDHKEMSARGELAPGVPDDYYRRIFDAEHYHFWYRGMRGAAVALLRDRMHAGGRLLDAGCGTGGFLRFAVDNGTFSQVAGVDIAAQAIALARTSVSEAELHVAPLHALPFPDAWFDLVVSTDVLQHVPESDVRPSLLELRRVLAPGGAMLVRTNGSRRLRREREDWRAYDAAELQRELEAAGFTVERMTHANALLSCLAALRRRGPHAPSEERHGIPTHAPGRLVTSLGRIALTAEARWIEGGHSLPFGHTLFALATIPES